MRVLDSRKFLFVAIVLLISALAVNGASNKGTAVVKDVSVNANGETLEVKITATDDARFTYFELKSPHRLVVDFHGIQNDIGFKEKQIDAAGVSRIRTSFYNDKKRQATRVVFDLKDGVPFQVVDDGIGIVRVVFGAASAAASGERPPLNLMAGPLAFVPEDTVGALYERPGGHRPPLHLFLPEWESPAPPARPVTQTPNPQTPLQPAQPAQPSNIIVGPPITPIMPLATPQPAPQYQGEIYSFELMDNFPIKDFFLLISQISGLNIVLDPNVTGVINIKLTDVPWDQALDIVLRNYGLTGVLQGNVLRIASNATIQAEQTARANLLAAQEQTTPLETRSYVFNYTTAAAAATTMTPMLSGPRARIIQDVRTNALIITDLPSQFARIDEIKAFLDRPSQQVEIEARLLSANKSFSRELGNQLGFLFGARSGNVVTGVPSMTSPVARTPTPRVSTGEGVPLAVNLPAGATSGLSFFIQPGGDIILDEIITAAEARGTAKLLSRPKVMTQNNSQATISRGTQIPVQTNVNNTISVQFLDFALKLTVTPQITEAGTILLTVDVENSQPDFARAVNSIPSVATQQATTQVLIPDGATAVVGGILVDADSLNIRQVPGLGSIPVLGHLFKHTQTIKSTSELFFFVTPRIKPPDALQVSAPGAPGPGGD